MSSSASGAIFQLNFIYGAEKRVCQLTHKVFDLPLASVYPLYVTKVSRKDRTEAELIKVITWLTGFDSRTLKSHLKNETSLRDFFKSAKINPNAKLITGSICGVKINEIENGLSLYHAIITGIHIPKN